MKALALFPVSRPGRSPTKLSAVADRAPLAPRAMGEQDHDRSPTPFSPAAHVAGVSVAVRV